MSYFDISYSYMFAINSKGAIMNELLKILIVKIESRILDLEFIPVNNRTMGIINEIHNLNFAKHQLEMAIYYLESVKWFDK